MNGRVIHISVFPDGESLRGWAEEWEREYLADGLEASGSPLVQAGDEPIQEAESRRLAPGAAWNCSPE
jgi:hypothetical protein